MSPGNDRLANSARIGATRAPAAIQTLVLQDGGDLEFRLRQEALEIDFDVSADYARMETREFDHGFPRQDAERFFDRSGLTEAGQLPVPVQMSPKPSDLPYAGWTTQGPVQSIRPAQS